MLAISISDAGLGLWARWEVPRETLQPAGLGRADPRRRCCSMACIAWACVYWSLTAASSSLFLFEVHSCVMRSTVCNEFAKYFHLKLCKCWENYILEALEWMIVLWVLIKSLVCSRNIKWGGFASTSKCQTHIIKLEWNLTKINRKWPE